jgi:hypothetical protein
MTRKIFTRLTILAGCLSLAFITPSAYAFDWNVGTAHVTRLEVSYMPNRISFQIDQAAGSQCPAGTFLIWNAQGADEAQQIANANAVYSTLLTAMMSGKPVTLYGNNSGCVVTFAHIYNG